MRDIRPIPEARARKERRHSQSRAVTIAAVRMLNHTNARAGALLNHPRKLQLRLLTRI